MSRFRDTSREFNDTNTAVVGVSVDSTWANKAFREQVKADFPILSDSRREVSRAYGVLNEESGFARRTTFVIDMEGIVRHVDQDRAAMDPSTALNVCRIIRK